MNICQHFARTVLVAGAVLYTDLKTTMSQAT